MSVASRGGGPPLEWRLILYLCCIYFVFYLYLFCIFLVFVLYLFCIFAYCYFAIVTIMYFLANPGIMLDMFLFLKRKWPDFDTDGTAEALQLGNQRSG